MKTVNKNKVNTISIVICIALIVTSLSSTVTSISNSNTSNKLSETEHFDVSSDVDMKRNKPEPSFAYDTSSNELIYAINFKKTTLETTTMNNQIFTKINMLGCISIGQKAGSPAMPVTFVKLLLPSMKKITNINITGTPVEIDTGNINLNNKPVVPYQNPMPIGSRSPKELDFDKSLYNSFNTYPSDVYKDHGIGYCRGYAILSLALNPIQYNPGEGRLFYYPKMTIDVELEDNGYVNQFYRNNADDEEWVKKLVYNPEIAESYRTSNLPAFDYPGGLCDPGDDYDYVIVTTTYNGLDHWETNITIPYNWTSLIDKHSTDDGLKCTLVTVQDIDACQDYWNVDPLFNDTSAHIREFCKDAYLDWGAEYVFVGGDDEWIPAREMDYDYESNVDSDIYWNHLDYTFNDDGDEFWGEKGDAGFDLYSEMYIGRITCDEPQDVSNWMKKSFYYADSNSQDYLDNAAFYGGITGWAAQGDDFIDYSAIKGTSNWFGPYPGEHGSYPSWLGFQYGFETWNTGNLGMEYNLSVKWTGEPPNPGWQGGSETMALEGLRNAINNDQCTLISAVAHANEEISMDVFASDWESNYHNTMPFFVHDYGCHCGDMDAADDGVLHSMLFHSDTELAFACVYNTCYGWGSFADTNSSSALQQKLFWDYMFDTANISGSPMNWQLGKAMAYSKDSMAPTINWTYSGAPGSWRGIIEGCLLFGDPAQTIKPPLRPEHNVGVKTLDVPSQVKPNEMIYVNASLGNNGQNNETDVLASFLVNGSLIDSSIIPFFESWTTADVSFTWTPSNAGVYTVTVNVTIPGIIEDIYLDNERSQTVLVGVLNVDTGELFDTIGEAITDNDTMDGHSIFVPCGTYHENIMVNKNVSLIGEKKDATVVEGIGSADSVIHIQNTDSVKIIRFTVKNGMYGVYIESSTNTIIMDDIISDNNAAGVYLKSSDNAVITNNEIANSARGILLTDCSNNNMVTENDITGNDEGLTVHSGSNYNNIYHNNFDNTQNAFDNGSDNQWDNGYYPGSPLCGGNWWSDYHGSDEFSGPLQDEPGSDGIGDTPYSVPGWGNQDRYPLMEPWVFNAVYVDDNNTNGPWYGIERYPYQRIQDGLDNSKDDDTVFVYSGIYYENVIIDRRVDLFGENMDTTIIDGGGMGDVIYVSANWVNITGFTVRNSGSNFTDHGIEVISDYNTISGNNIIDNTRYGISLASSDYNTIYENTIANNDYGISLTLHSSTNNITGNTIINNYRGICLEDTACNNIITGNTIINNTWYGIHLSSFNNVVDNIIVNNSLGIWLEYSWYNNIFRNTIRGSTYGIKSMVIFSDSNIISRGNITNNDKYGVFQLGYSINNTISENVIEYNEYGIHLDLLSNNNDISENIVTNNDYGIYLFQFSNNNDISENIVTNNNYSISLIYSCNNNTITGNNIINSYCDAIQISDSSYNIISENQLANSRSYGIYLLTWDMGSFNNIIYHNNLINNSLNAYDEGTNIWDNGYPSGGNYWDDYNGSDNFSGPGQDEPDPDDIGDTPYNISGGDNQDRYPLMDPWSSLVCGDINNDGVIDIGDVVYLINYLFKAGPEPEPMLCIGDVNGDEQITVGDVVYLINYLFRGGPPPGGCCQ